MTEQAAPRFTGDVHATITALSDAADADLDTVRALIAPPRRITASGWTCAADIAARAEFQIKTIVALARDQARNGANDDAPI